MKYKLSAILCATLFLSGCATNYMGDTKLQWWIKTHSLIPPFELQP